MRDPQSPAEWQEAVAAANFALLVDAARQYGLVKTEQRPNIERCEEILRRGAAMGIHPKPIE